MESYGGRDVKRKTIKGNMEEDEVDGGEEKDRVVNDEEKDMVVNDEEKDMVVNDEEEASIVQSDFECLLGESFDFYGLKRENDCNYDDIVTELHRLGWEAKRIYRQAVKFLPSICSEIEDLIPQMEDHCSYLMGNDASEKQKDRFNRVKELLNSDAEAELEQDIFVITDKRSIERDIKILLCFAELYTDGNFDNDKYTEAKRLCTKSIILKEYAKKWEYSVARIENLMDAVFSVVSEHYELTAPSQEVEMNLALQNKRCKGDKSPKLNFYNRFLGSKKLKIPETSHKEFSFCQNIRKIGSLKKSHQILYRNCQKYLSLRCLNYFKKSPHHAICHLQKIVLYTIPQMIANASNLKNINQKQVESVRKLVASTKKMKEVFADGFVWYRNYPFLYFPASKDTESELLKQKPELTMKYFLFQAQLLKSMVKSYLKQKANSKRFYKKAVQLATEIVRLNRRSLDHATFDAQTDIHKLTLRLYRQVVDHYESQTSKEQKKRNLKAQNKDEVKRVTRKYLHFINNASHCEQLSFKSFLININYCEDSSELTEICEGYADLNWEDEGTSVENMFS